MMRSSLNVISLLVLSFCFGKAFARVHFPAQNHTKVSKSISIEKHRATLQKNRLDVCNASGLMIIGYYYDLEKPLETLEPGECHRMEFNGPILKIWYPVTRQIDAKIERLNIPAGNNLFFYQSTERQGEHPIVTYRFGGGNCPLNQSQVLNWRFINPNDRSISFQISGRNFTLDTNYYLEMSRRGGCHNGALYSFGNLVYDRDIVMSGVQENWLSLFLESGNYEFAIEEERFIEIVPTEIIPN